MILCLFFFFNETATTEIYTLSLHDALPISIGQELRRGDERGGGQQHQRQHAECAIHQHRRGGFGEPHVVAGEIVSTVHVADRKSTRLNSSHAQISYSVFFL